MTFEWCDLNKQRIFYSNWAKAHVLQLMQHKGVTYGELADELRAHGVVLDRHALTNKLHRGTYSFTFALQVFAALGETNIPVPRLPADLQRLVRPSSARAHMVRK